MKKTTTLLSVLVVCCLSCRKDDESVCNSTSHNYDSRDIPVDSFRVRNFFFGQGSYWIYKDEANNLEDSVYVVSTEKTEGHYLNKGAGCSDIYDFYFNLGKVNLSGTVPPTFYYLKNDALHLDGSNIMYYWLMMNSQGEIKEESGMVEYLPSLSVDGIIYQDVYKTTPGGYAGGARIGSHFYVNDSIGIVQKDLLQTDGSYHRYYLKRYSIAH